MQEDSTSTITVTQQQPSHNLLSYNGTTRICTTFCEHQNLLQVIILDIRYPSVPITQLARHHACVNALAWAPHSASHLCTAGDDAQVRRGSEREPGVAALTGR